ncbi:MAG: DUF2911 domain-containing protein [Verrucomicrobiota bacterium]
MKISAPLVFPLLLGLVLLPLLARAQTVTLPRPSPLASVMQRIGLSDVSVTYSRPSVRDREVWGELVPWGFTDLGFGTAKASPWRAGANENTVFTTSTPLRIEGERLPAGTYGLFMAIAPSGEVTVIFSHDHESWGSYFYDPALDALRITTQWAEAPFSELLTYQFSNVTESSATLELRWEAKRIPFLLEAETPLLTMESLARELRGEKGFVHRSWVNAARYALQHDLQLETALEWIDQALTGPLVGRETFAAYELKAQILEHLGRPGAALAVMDRAVQIGSASDLFNYGRTLLALEQPERAFEVLQLNVERHPGQWPAAFGVAHAIEWLERATADLSAQDTASRETVQRALEKLRRGERLD